MFIGVCRVYDTIVRKERPNRLFPTLQDLFGCVIHFWIK
jgi:hypothetical protein